VLRSLLDSAGLRPRKRLGQCFLIDRNLMNKLADAAEIGPADCVLEVGCGTGSLTALLAARAGRVVAAEVDPDLAKIAHRQLAAYQNVRFLCVDALKSKSTVAPEVVDAVQEGRQGACGKASRAVLGPGRLRLKLVANLPYDIATPLIIDLLLGGLPFVRYCFTVQQEVAERFLAEPNGQAFGPVAVMAQALTRGRRVAKVPPQAFWPEPKVSSAMLCLDARPPEQVRVTEPAAFAEFVRAFFRFRRKTMSHIARTLDMAEWVLPALASLGISPRARPQNVAVDQWVSLHRACGCHQTVEGI